MLKNGSASSYGKALVNLQDNLSQYSDSYIDAPFTQIMIWHEAQVIILGMTVKTDKDRAGNESVDVWKCFSVLWRGIGHEGFR